MVKVIMKRCPVCRNKFPGRTKDRIGTPLKVRRNHYIRGINSFTCSEKCSKIYHDVSKYVKMKLKASYIKKLAKIAKEKTTEFKDIKELRKITGEDDDS